MILSIWYKKQVGLFDADKNETKVEINSLDEIYEYADQLKETVGYYEEQ